MEQKLKFMPIDYDYFDFEGRNYARVVGRDSKGKRVCVIDTCDIYVYAILNDGVSDKRIETVMRKIEGIRVEGKNRVGKVLRTELVDKKFLGNNVKAIKIFINNYKDAHSICDEIGYKEVFKRREYDLNFITKYIIERKLRPMHWYEVSGNLLNNSSEYGGFDSSIEVDLCLDIVGNEIKEVGGEDYRPKVLAFDIETDEFDIGGGRILMFSLVGEGFRRVVSWHGGGKHASYVEMVRDEEELLERFVELVREYDSDILTGYYSDGFDLPYLRARAEKLRVDFSLGLNGSAPKFRRGKNMTGRVDGIVHVDLLRFIRIVYSQYMQSETMGLSDVAHELLGEKKDDWQFVPVEKIKGKMWDDFFRYNLKDSDLTYRLFQKIWPDMLEITKIIQEPLFDSSRYSMSNIVENYIMHNLEGYDEIIEKKPVNDMIGARREMGKYEGAFVFQPIPGLYEDVVFFDFTSMYGSVIVSFNLSKESLLAKKERGSTLVELDKKVYFSKDKGFFSRMLAGIIEKRKKSKKEYGKNKDPILKARSNAFKLLANSAYGYLGFFGARYYSREAAASTANLARNEIKKAIELIGKKGYNVVYSDTDSIAFLQNGKSKKEVNKLLDEINDDLPGIMELDLEGFFKRGIWVTKRNGEFGAKKKYALLNEEEKLVVKGFETVRRDWCKLARDTQSKILEMILRDGDEKKALEYLKKIVKKLKNREIDNEELIIKTQLKRDISDYRASGPHVIVAKKMKEAGIKVGVGSLIEYYISEGEGRRSLVRDRAKMPSEKGEYDIEYYLKNQILPALENIIEVFGVDVNEIFEGKKQTSLGDF